MIIGVDVVFIHIKDPVKMSKWYQDVLGLNIGFKTDDMSWLEFKFDEKRPPTRFALEQSSGEQQPIMMSFRVDDIYSAIAEMESRGGMFLGDEKIRAEGISLFATLQDPEGNLVQISQRRTD